MKFIVNTSIKSKNILQSIVELRMWKLTIFTTLILYSLCVGYKETLDVIYPEKYVTFPKHTRYSTYNYKIEHEPTITEIEDKLWNSIQTVVTTKNLFKENIHSKPLYILGTVINNHVNQIKKYRTKLNQFLKPQKFGLPNDNNTLINSTTLLPDLSTQEILELSAVIEPMFDTTIDKASSESELYLELFNKVYLLELTISQYTEDLIKFYTLINCIISGKCYQNMPIVFESILSLTPNYQLQSIHTSYYAATDTSLSFDLTVVETTDALQVIQYKSIPMENYILDAKLYSNEMHENFFQLECNNEKCIKQAPGLCESSIHNGTLDMIIANCEFKPNNMDFEITDIGIFIYSTPNAELTELLETFDIELTSFPSLVQFTGCFNLTDQDLITEKCFEFKRSVISSKYQNINFTELLEPRLIHRTIENLTDLDLILAINIMIVGSMFMILICKCVLKTCNYKNQRNAHAQNRRHQQPSRTTHMNHRKI